MGRLPGALEQTRKECYFISGILGKEGQREGSWAVRGWRERMDMNANCSKTAANRKDGRKLIGKKDLLGARNGI